MVFSTSKNVCVQLFLSIVLYSFNLLSLVWILHGQLATSNSKGPLLLFCITLFGQQGHLNYKAICSADIWKAEICYCVCSSVPKQLLGHSCKIGNMPILEANNKFIMFPLFWWYFWHRLVITYMEKDKGQLKKKKLANFWAKSHIHVSPRDLATFKLIFILMAQFII